MAGGPYRHAFERTWNAIEILCGTESLKVRVSRAYLSHLSHLSGARLPAECQEILQQLGEYFSNDARDKISKDLGLVSVAKNNELIMTGALAKFLAERIRTFARLVFFARSEEVL
jgi:hypothetical protein